MTESEKHFEQILQSYGIPFEKIPESTKDGEKRPDYLVGNKLHPTYWEVKELKENPKEKTILAFAMNNEQKVYTIDSTRVTDGLKRAFKQFEKYGVTDHPCIITYYDARDFFTKDLFFEQKITSLIVGDGHYMENQNGDLHEIGRTKSILSREKPYISGLAIIRSNNELVFYHNPHTKNPVIEHSIFENIPIQYVTKNTGMGLQWQKRK